MAAFIVPAFRQGTLIHVPGRGRMVNGKIDDAAAKVLRGIGQTVVPHVWCEPQPKFEELREMMEADKILGRKQDREGRAQLDRDLSQNMNELLKPLRKRTYFPSNRRGRRTD